MNAEDRTHPNNGIWLCLRCHKIIDSEPDWATKELLRSWKKDAESRAVNNSAEDDFKQTTIDSLTIAIRSLDNLLDQFFECSLIRSDALNKVIRQEIDWTEYNRVTDENFDQKKREYEKIILPEIQTALLKCQKILGESNEIVINTFKNLEHSSCNQLTMKDMMPILYELKENIQWR